jgi:hypothetical protein
MNPTKLQNCGYAFRPTKGTFLHRIASFEVRCIKFDGVVRPARPRERNVFAEQNLADGFDETW